jgi:hypothetical protein
MAFSGLGSLEGQLMADNQNEQIDRLHRLVQDLRRLQDGFVPTDADLAGVPLLEAWSWVLDRGHLCAMGIVSQHPFIEDGHRCVTSAVMVVAENDAWVRTVNRFYRLGRPMASHVGGLDG